MISAHLGLKREVQINPWVKCAELHVHPSGKAHLSITALRVGLLQGRAFDGALTPFLDGDIFVASQWIGHIMTNETETGTWYTAVIELIPVLQASPAGIITGAIR
jgi:hypothetical protein